MGSGFSYLIDSIPFKLAHKFCNSNQVQSKKVMESLANEIQIDSTSQ